MQGAGGRSERVRKSAFGKRKEICFQDLAKIFGVSVVTLVLPYHRSSSGYLQERVPKTGKCRVSAVSVNHVLTYRALTGKELRKQRGEQVVIKRCSIIDVR